MASCSARRHVHCCAGSHHAAADMQPAMRSELTGSDVCPTATCMRAADPMCCAMSAGTTLPVWASHMIRWIGSGTGAAPSAAHSRQQQQEQEQAPRQRRWSATPEACDTRGSACQRHSPLLASRSGWYDQSGLEIPSRGHSVLLQLLAMHNTAGACCSAETVAGCPGNLCLAAAGPAWVAGSLSKACAACMSIYLATLR